MKKIILPILLTLLISSCSGGSDPTNNPTVDPTETPTVEPTETPTETPTEVPTEEPTVDPTEIPTETPTETPTEKPNHDITVEMPDDLGVDLVYLEDAKKLKKGDFLYAFGVVAQFTYGYGDNGNEKVGFYLVDNTSSMYVYAGVGNLINVDIGDTVLVNGSITYFISQAESGAGQEIGYDGAQQIAADVVEIISNDYHDIPDTGIEKRTIKELSTTNFRDEDLSGTIFHTTATITKNEVSGTQVFYFNDLSMDYSLYTYSTISGAEFGWLNQYVGKSYECLIAVHSLRSKDEAWRIIPIDFYFEVEISDEDTANFALDRLAKQFSPTYNSTTEVELLSQDSKLLDSAEISYTTNSNDHIIINDNGSYKLSINGEVFGKFTVTISLKYNGETYTKDVEIEVIEKLKFDGITIAEAYEVEEGQIVKIKGILIRFAANVQGVYIADETGIMVVYHTKDFIYEDYLLGEELVFEGEVVIDFVSPTQGYSGHKRLSNATLISHDSTVHEWNKDLVEGELTVSDLLKTDINKIGKIYKVYGTITTYESPYFDAKRFTSGSSYLTLYCSSASQLSWLDEYEDREGYVYMIVRDVKDGNGAMRVEILDLA